MLLALGGCCLGLGSNSAVNADGFAAGYFGLLALAYGGAYSTHVKNPVFVVASFSKVVLPLLLCRVLLVSSWLWCRFGFPVMLLALGGYRVGLGSNPAVNADGFAAGYFGSLDREKMTSQLTQSKMLNALDWAYDKAVGGIPGFDSAQELAACYMRNGNCKISQANSLIRWQNTKAGTSGFLTGLGGVITMPVTIPANIASVMYVQLRMISAIAHIGDYDIRDDRVKTMVYACLTGNAAKDILKDAGIIVGRKLTENAIKNISGKTILKINEAVGFRLVTKFGETGIINLGKAVPLLGGIIGATFDSVTTNIVGNVARDTFITTKIKAPG